MITNISIPDKKGFVVVYRDFSRRIDRCWQMKRVYDFVEIFNYNIIILRVQNLCSSGQFSSHCQKNTSQLLKVKEEKGRNRE